MYYLLCRIKPDSREDLTETLCILRADTSGINTSFCFPTGHFSRDFHARKYNFTQACSAIREGYQRMRIHVHSCSRYKLIRHPYLRLSPGIFWGDENFLLIFIVLFFHYHLTFLYLPPPVITPLLSMSMSSFSFVLNPSTPYSLPIAVILLSIYECVSIMLVSSVCLLDSTHE